jgi:O-antigen ligase/tetratricopeptide (TPR) repeat protein
MLGRLSWRFAELSLLTALIAVPMAYIYQVDDRFYSGVSRRIVEFVAALRGIDPADAAMDGLRAGIWAVWHDQMSFYLNAFAPVLEMKLYVWVVCGMLLATGLAGARLVDGLARVPSIPGDAQALDGAERGGWRRWPVIGSGIAFILLGALSIRFWLPDPAPGATLEDGGFAQSVITLAGVAFAFVFLVMAEDLMRTRRFVAKALFVLFGVGVANAFMVFLLQVRPGWLNEFWVAYSEAEHRNQFGAFIGHNTGVSAFLIAPTFIALALLVGFGRQLGPWTRGFLALALVLFGYALILAQSRAVVPLLGLGMAAFLWMARRRGGFRLTRPAVMGAALSLAVLVATQLIPGNPFYRRDVTLVDRLEDVTPSRLITEARLRLLVCSMPLVAEAPLLGHGIGSFQYVYPAAQGRYFQDNPDTPLVPVSSRSFHAHNEYLQTLVELGAVGLGLLLLGLGSALRMGLGAMRSTLAPERLCIQLGLLCAIGVQLAQAAVDIPMRVAPLALSLSVLLAVWMAGRRLWLVLPADEAPPAVTRPVPPPVRQASLAALALAGTVAVAVAAAWVGGRGFGNWYVGELLASAASAKLQFAQQEFERAGRQALPFIFELHADAVADNRDAAARLARGGDFLMNEARLSHFLAILQLTRSFAASAAGREQEASLLRKAAVISAEDALSRLAIATSETYYDEVHFMRSRLLRFIVATGEKTPQERAALVRDSLDALRRTVMMNPGRFDAAMELIGLLDGARGADNEAELAALVARLHHIDPPFVRNTLLRDVHDALYLSDYELAVRWSRRLARAIPGETVYRHTLATALLRAGLTDEAAPLCQALAEAAPADPGNAFMMVQLAIREGRLDSALNILNERVPEDDRAVPATLVAATRAFLLQRLSRENTRFAVEAGEAATARLEELARRNPLNVQLVATTAYETFDDPALALPWLERRRAIADPPADAQTLAMLARAYLRLGRAQDAAALLPELEPHASSTTKRIIYSRLASEIEAAAAPEKAP